MPTYPGVNHFAAVKALEKAGVRIARQGKQIVMIDGTRIITVPRHNPVNAITMAKIIQLEPTPHVSVTARNHNNRSIA